jgi:hypothetical protein
MAHLTISPRAKFRQSENKRIMNSASLSETFPKLKSLKVELSFFQPDGLHQSGQIKYAVNLLHAKSVFRFDCTNKECVRGDYDLSDVLAAAVAGRELVAEGEMCCHGWRNKDVIRKVYCRNILRYKLRLAYSGRAKR